MPIHIASHALTAEQAALFVNVLRDDPSYREKLDSAVTQGEQRLFAAHFNGKPVGVALLAGASPQLEWMVVHPATRGRGVGRDFLRLLEKETGSALTLPEGCTR